MIRHFNTLRIISKGESDSDFTKWNNQHSRRKVAAKIKGICILGIGREMSLTDHDERRFLKHLQHATSTYLDVGVEYPELLDDLPDPVLDGGDVDVDAEGEVELVVDGVHVAQLLEEHRPLHVARGRRRRRLPSFRSIGHL